MNDFHKRQVGLRCWRCLFLLAMALLLAFACQTGFQTLAQDPPAHAVDQGIIRGKVTDAQGRPVLDATVRIQAVGRPGQETKSDTTGGFQFDSLPVGTYQVSAEKMQFHSFANVSLVSPEEPKQLALVLTGQPDHQVGAADMAFSDNPDFTIAGVTDWTAVGGHGSDVILRTSEDLARDTATLKSSVNPPRTMNTREAKRADGIRRAAELAEKSGDPLTAVQQFQQAVKLDPSEQNYYEWGSELLLHRAIWQAVEVFRAGSEAYPHSVRMETALGAALFAGARYKEAAQKLCDASDLEPTSTQPYVFMGKAEIASPDPLPCVEKRLARFVENQPKNSLAIYLYAAALARSQETDLQKRAEALFRKATELDPGCADAFLQLGIIYANRRVYDQAISFYLQAIAVNPALADAHYRLAVAYDRSGHPDKAALEFKRHDEIQKQQAAEAERERREVKQFEVRLDPVTSPARQ